MITMTKSPINEKFLGVRNPFFKKGAAPPAQKGPAGHFEGNVEYIKIPGGTYQYSVSKKMVTVPDLFFCKYPVTNKRYRRFISFLGGKEKELEKELSFDMFAERLLKFAGTIKGYSQYLEKDSKEWEKQLGSNYDNDKKFNGDDQPVVWVTWYAARAYCFWLSCLEAAVTGDNHSLNRDISRLASLYRLPTEQEWEWMGNYYDEDKVWLALRGGSWASKEGSLFCSARCADFPLNYWDLIMGFRVLRASSP